jgi:hypothetical protein
VTVQVDMVPTPAVPTTTNMQLSYKLPSYISLLAQMCASKQLQAFKVIEGICLPC